MGRTTLILALGLLAACRPTFSTAAPPTLVCGTTLAGSVAGSVVFDIARYPSIPTVTAETVGDVLIVRVSDDCARGSTVGIVPVTAARIVKTAPASDGLPEAVVLKPAVSEPGRVVATQDGRVVGVLNFRISP
ncbi:MAG TPA: hypothetical protein VEM41_03465 [Actinomycetota bacterium]|nr:hypothetical protein [Actinomycetota bacterium]